MANTSALTKAKSPVHGMSSEAKIVVSILLPLLLSIFILGAFHLSKRVHLGEMGGWEGGRDWEGEELLGVSVH